MICKYEQLKEHIGWWGKIMEKWCNKNHQWLAGPTCNNCEENKWLKNQQKD